MTVLAILFVLALLVPIGFLVAEPARRRGRARRRPQDKAAPRRPANDLPVGDLVEAALDARASRRASSPTHASAAPVRFRASSGRVVTFPHAPAPERRSDEVPVEQSGDGTVAEAVDVEAVDVDAADVEAVEDEAAVVVVEATERPADGASDVGDGSDVEPVSWDPVEGDSCGGGVWDDD